MTKTPPTGSSSSLSSLPDSPAKLTSLRIRHTRIKQIMTELDTLIYPESQDKIFLVCGPTGVGKSTLARHMVDAALEKASADMEADAGLIPAAYVEAPASGEDAFSWRLFYLRTQAQLDGDLIFPKTAYGVNTATGRLVRPYGNTSNNLGDIRTSVENALCARGTRFLVIDEAAHIIRQTRHNRLQVQLDTLKSLANAGRTQMVLVGSYDLYQLVSLSGELARRIHVVHFERYREDSPEDRQAFRGCIQKFQSALPALWGQQLMQHADALQENTLGCIGTLSSVLTRAAMLAQRDGKWSVEALRRALLTEAQRQKILEEILDGEAAINPLLTRTMPHSPRRASKNERSAA